MISMSLETTRAKLARYPVFQFHRELYFVLDMAVIALIFILASIICWGSLARWRVPEVALPAATIAVSLPLTKITILRSETDRVRRLAKLHIGLLITYSLLTSYLVLSRSYYSRSFLLVSLGLILIWQVIDTLFISVKFNPRLVAIPSRMTDRIRLLPNTSVRVLQRPKLEEQVDGVVVDLHEHLQPDWQKFIAECAATGMHVYHAAAVYESYTGRVPLSHLSESMIMDYLGGGLLYRRIKRVLDISAVIISMPILLPLSIVLIVLIKLDSPGPALYWQERVGERGTPFRMVKFRSMYVEAEKNGAQFAAADDPRVTRVGRLMRRYRLDELPQLWNVLRGEMSLIGPRPEQVSFAQAFEAEIPFYSWRHNVKPGITGWAQVQQGYVAGVDDTRIKTEYDLYYVKHLSFWLDLSILLRTVGTVVSGNGSR